MSNNVAEGYCSDTLFTFLHQLKLPELDEAHADMFSGYEAMWADLQDTVEFVPHQLDVDNVRVIQRILRDDAQADSPKKVDLVEQVQDLTGLPGGAGEFFHEFMSGSPDRKVLRRLGAPYNARVSFEKTGAQGTAVLYFRNGFVWPESIGGEWEAETMRSIQVTCRYAAWRNRRARRLARVKVTKFLVAPRVDLM